MEAFLELYQLANNHLISVENAGFFSIDGWRWNVVDLFTTGIDVSEFLQQELVTFL